MSSLHERRFLQGVLAYAREQSPIWSVHWGSGLHPEMVEDLRSKDGLFTFGVSAPQKIILEALGLPIVNFSSVNLPWPGVASVSPDNGAIGWVAAEYFLERLHRNFLFFGAHSHSYSRERREGFRRRLAGRDVQVVDQFEPREDQDAKVVSVLRRCQRPLAVFAANDVFARRICRLATAEGFAVPEELAILGADREDLISLSSPVPLSSVDVNSEGMGRRAAAIIHGIRDGSLPPSYRELFPPRAVATDFSTDTLATEDSGLAKALRFIREQAFQQIQVEDVARHAGVGRRTLERKFSALVGRSIDQSIRQTRIKRARSLLRESKLSLDEIAERCGFSSTDYFSKVFKSQVGQSPGAFRRTP